MNPYDPSAKCKQCGCVVIDTVYYNYDNKPKAEVCRYASEGLLSTCPCCGYQWVDETLVQTAARLIKEAEEAAQQGQSEA